MRRETHRIWLAVVVCLALSVTLAGSAAASPGGRASNAPETPADAPQQLGTGHPFDVAVAGDYAFWTQLQGEFCSPGSNDGRVRRVHLRTLAVATLRSGCDFSPANVVADSSHVYYIDWTGDTVERIPVGGGSSSTVASGNGLIYHRALTLDSTHVYFGDNDGMKKVPKAGGTVNTLAAGYDSTQLAVDDNYVYWTERSPGGGGAIRRVSKHLAGGTVDTLVSGSSLDDPWGIAVDSTRVYFTELGSGKARRMPKAGGTISDFVPTQPSYMASDIAVDGTNAYWLDTTGTATGRLRRAPKGGGTVQDLALGLFGPTGLNVTSSHVFWGDWNGVWRLPIGASEVAVDLTITDVEVTQGIQCLDNTTGDTGCNDNTVQLIANKLTYVRVYPAVDIADTVNVNARLTGTRGGTPLSGSPLAPDDTTLFVSTSGASRENSSSSFNFLLPNSWRSGTVVLQAEINPGTVIAESDTTNNLSTAETITFAAAENLTVAYVPINYTFSGWTGANTANAATMTACGPFLRSLYPFSQVTYFAWPAGAAFTQNVRTNPSSLINELNTRYLASSSPPDQLFAWMPDGSWDNGRSDPIWGGGSGHVSGGDENLGNAVCAHEIGHNLGRRHQNCFDSASDWPYGGTNADIGIQEVGFDVFSLTTHPATKPDIMTGGNCGNSSLDMWISPHNWTNILNGVQDWLVRAQSGQQRQGPTVIVAGQVTEQGGSLSPIWVLDEYLPPAGIPEGREYCLSFLNDARALLLEHCFNVDIRNRRWTGVSDVGTFAMRFAYPPETHLVRLSRGMEVLDERQASKTRPQVEVVAPNGGEQWYGIEKVMWQGRDADGDRLTYNVLYSPDMGQSWQSLASGLTETSLEVNAQQIAGTEMGLMKVLASDGLLTGQDQSDEPFVVRPHAPEVHIYNPADGAGYEPNELILLTGSAYDLEDGPLTGDQMRWLVSGLGEVGQGSETALRIQEPGSYHVTLEAYDSDQARGEDSVDIFVGPTISVEPAYATIGVSQTMSVELRIADVFSLYAAQVELTFDSSVLEVRDASEFDPGVQIREGDFPVPDTIIRNQVDNNRGIIQYAVSLQGAKDGVSGTGTLATIVFHGKEVGLGRVRFTGAILSDPQSVQIPSRTEDGAINVRQAMGELTGRVILERRDSNAGAQVCVGELCTFTGGDGFYYLADPRPSPKPVEISRQSYLRTWRQVDVPIGQLELPPVTLLAGDVNADDHIEQFDAMSLGLAWNSTPMDMQWDGRADITDDGSVNILDMVGVQFNWDEQAPGPWEGVQARQQMPAARGDLAGVDAATQVVISPSSASLAGTGETVDLDIRVQDVVDMYGGRVQLTFNPAVVQVVDADPRGSAPGIQIRPGDFLDVFNQFVLVNEADNVAGTIDYAVTQLHPAVGRSGSGVLATIRFEAVGQGSSPVHLADVRLGDDTRPDPVEIPAGTQDGLVTVGAQNRIYLPLTIVE